ncbi:hypothetical protein [Ruminococcus flavefaciens]|uniref:hypothetical protein n=1 Tax=Ruminococcus flavefaciens TaxID=1265 RepID=UPI00031972D3|nr:hypothetical protein [Ruminococcus flavefaciens]
MRLTVQLKGRKSIRLLPINVKEYYQIFHPVNDSEKIFGLTDWIARSDEEKKSSITVEDLYIIEIELLNWLRTEREKERYKAPYYKQAAQNEVYFTREYDELKLVSDYTNSSFGELQELDIFTFWRYYRDAVIWNCSKTEEGREYLRNAYNSVQTKPDRAAIAQLISSQ